MSALAARGPDRALTEPRTLEVRGIFGRPALAGMDFLNEAPHRFPGAISLASGRPELAKVRACMPWLDPSSAPAASVGGIERYQQYGPTTGLACDTIADWVTERTGVFVGADDVIVTTGAQEGITLVLLALCEPGVDAILVPDPTYLGILGAALMLGIDVVPVGPAASLDPAAIRAGADRAAAAGRRARVLYLIADHDNPTGDSIPVDVRGPLVAAAAELGMLVLEDVAYREVGSRDAPLPSLIASGEANVMQLGTFAKIVFPGLRLGYLAMPRSAAAKALLQACRLAKSFTTLNTAAPSQAILAHVLRHERPRLLAAVGEMRAYYRHKRETVLDALASSRLAGCGAAWNVPAGGFFVTVRLPFAFGTDELERCALDYGVIVSPMRYFSLSRAVEHDVRIACSAIGVGDLREGIARFARFVAEIAPSTREPRASAS